MLLCSCHVSGAVWDQNRLVVWPPVSVSLTCRAGEPAQFKTQHVPPIFFYNFFFLTLLTTQYYHNAPPVLKFIEVFPVLNLILQQ